MGLAYEDIELTNWYDLENARRYIIGEDEVKKLTVSMPVDTGAYMLNINETIQEVLQLPFVQRRKGQTADGRIMEYDVVGPVRVEFQGRISTCNAMVLPGENEPLLGAIPMEEMDLVVLPQRQKLVVNPDHPDYPLMQLK
jgi:clan AA aspartic protease